MGIFDRFLPKKKQPEVKNTIPQEKANIKKTFGVYCNKHHSTKGEKLCPKCTALLATVMTKINRCPYGITKPICDRCERQCFGKAQNTEFMKIMTSSSKGMFLKHPMMTMKHKMASLSVDYAKREQEKRQAEKAAAKKKNAEAKAKAKEEGKKEKYLPSIRRQPISEQTYKRINKQKASSRFRAYLHAPDRLLYSTQFSFLRFA